MFKDLSYEERKVLLIWCVVGVIIFAFAIVLKLFVVNEENSKIYAEPYKVLQDRDRYYTVNGALTKYYSFINAKNYKSVVNILDNKYVLDNGINENNVSEYLTKTENLLSYVPKVMCFKLIGEGITSYYVEGHEVSMNTSKELDSKYYEVILDGNDLVFSVKPLDEKTYGGKCHE